MLSELKEQPKPTNELPERKRKLKLKLEPKEPNSCNTPDTNSRKRKNACWKNKPEQRRQSSRQ